MMYHNIRKVLAFAPLYLATLLPLQSVHADEGMWTLFDLPSAIYDQMQQKGFQLPYTTSTTARRP